MSLLDNHQLKIVTNVQITIYWYQIRMTSIQEITQVPVTHVGQSHPAKTCNGIHPLNVFCKTENPKHMKRFRMSEALPDI